jgi:hypothetical protein
LHKNLKKFSKFFSKFSNFFSKFFKIFFLQDPKYYERRQRNNFAAKRCRANRRALYEFRYQRAKELEDENDSLKKEMENLKAELATLKQILLKKQQVGQGFAIQPMDPVTLEAIIASNVALAAAAAANRHHRHQNDSDSGVADSHSSPSSLNSGHDECGDKH